MIRYGILFGLLCAVLLPLGLQAQTRPLTLEETITIGLENSRQVHSSAMRSEYAGAKAREASSALYPSVKVQAGYTRLSDVPQFVIPVPGMGITFPVILDNYSAKATLTQPLFTGGKLQGAADIASANAEAAQTDLAKDRSELVYSVTQAYWNLYRMRELKRLNDEAVKQFERHAADIENMMKQGMAVTNDVLKVNVQLANARLMQSDAENNVRLALLTLNSLIGLPLETEIAVTSTLTPASQTYPAISSLIATAMSERPDVKSTDFRLQAAETGVKSAKGGWLPQLMLTGSYTYADPNPRIFPAVDKFKDTWDVGVSLQFDLWNNLSTLYQTDAARAQYEQAKDAVGLTKDAVVLDVTQNYLSFEQAKKRIQLAQLQVEQSAENLRVNQEKFGHGDAISSDLLDAEVADLQSKTLLTQALVEYELAKARLDKAIGGGR
jgi:outer membrane protein